MLQGELTRSSAAFFVNDGRLATEIEPGALHDARVELRRIRSLLRTFRSLFDPSWLSGALAQISWYQTQLGEVRDVDVVIARLLRAGNCPRVGSDSAKLTAMLAADRAVALRGVAAARANPRHEAATSYLDVLAGTPPMRRRAAADARKALPRLLGRPWRNLRESARVARKEPTDAALHTVRIRAKELRFASELAIPVLGDDAAKLAKACATLQRRLGRHRDAVAAAAWLRSAATEAPEVAFFAGQLAVVQHQRAAELAGAWPKEMKQVERAWGRLRRKHQR
ncbi:MAG: hypothetical protein JWO62_685 [Acidimicrobiaceae bacterium]|nr:hypothetical protein [Acidimicrobiaceae bacterium]